jgi:4-amino-4-deoxy-L-arabinose transferase-like glycosyltransferase
MLESGDHVVPRLNGTSFLEKPPLVWWVESASLYAFGFTPSAARLPSALFGLLTLLATFEFGRRFGGRSVGILSMFVLASTALFAENVTRVLVDPALMFFVALAHFGFGVLAEPKSEGERRGAILLIAVATPLAFLTKGVVALGLGLAPPILYLLVTRRRRAVADLALLAAVAIPVFALFVVPWFMALAHHASLSAVRECLVANTSGRFLNNQAGRHFGHRQPFYYYLTAAAVVLLPWSLAIPALVRDIWGRLQIERPGIEARRLLLASSAIGLVALSFAASKRELYLLPLLPAFAVCVGSWLAAIEDPAEGAEAGPWGARPTLLAILGLGALIPLILGAAALAAKVSTHPGVAVLKRLLVPSVLALLLLTAMALFELFAILFQRCRLRPRSVPQALALAYLATFLFLQIEVKSIVDPIKNLDDLTRSVTRFVPGLGPVAAYLPPLSSAEALFGIIEFNLGRQTEPLKSPEDLVAHFETHPNVGVIVRFDQVEQLPVAIRSHLRFLYDERGLKAMPYGIATWCVN